MTRLLDSGYLETDSPIVAACFLDRSVKVEGGAEAILDSVDADGITAKEDQLEFYYPILMPAATVAEKCRDLEIRDFIRKRAKCETWEWISWIGAHTGEGE